MILDKHSIYIMHNIHRKKYKKSKKYKDNENKI